jgi:CBS domain-containing protein
VATVFENKKVRDIMVPISEYPVIYDDAPVSEAIRILTESFHQKDRTWYGFQVVLAVNRRGKLTGLLTLRGFLKALKLQTILDHFLTSDSEGLIFMPQFYNSMEILTKDIMRPLDLITVQADSDIFEAMVTMVEGKVNSLPVFSGRELVGLVRTIDMFWVVGEFLD